METVNSEIKGQHGGEAWLRMKRKRRVVKMMPQREKEEEIRKRKAFPTMRKILRAKPRR